MYDQTDPLGLLYLRYQAQSRDETYPLPPFVGRPQAENRQWLIQPRNLLERVRRDKFILTLIFVIFEILKAALSSCADMDKHRVYNDLEYVPAK